MKAASNRIGLRTAVLVAAVLAIVALPNSASAQVEAKPAATELTIPEAQRRMEAQLQEPYRIAAAVVAADRPEAKTIANVGAFQGQFLAAFLDRFPNAKGEYAEPATSSNPHIARKRLAKYGDRVSYMVGCASRDVSEGCVSKDSDVIVVEWLSIHQNLDGMYRVYRAAAGQLPPGGWFVTLDHVTFGGTAWEEWFKKASTEFRPAQEGPGLHHADYRVPTLEEQLGAMRAAGFDAEVVWQSFNTVLFMGRKK